MAIRDDELAANCMGINSFYQRHRVRHFWRDVRFAGSLFRFGYISATSFDLSQSQLYLVMISWVDHPALSAAIGSYCFH